MLTDQMKVSHMSSNKLIDKNQLKFFIHVIMKSNLNFNCQKAISSLTDVRKIPIKIPLTA